MQSVLFYGRFFIFIGVIIQGIICRAESKDYYFLSVNDNKIIRCSLKGKIKHDFRLKKDKQFVTDIVVVGDLVNIDLNQDGTGVIKNITPRKNYLSRKAPKVKGASYRGERLEQIIAANIDQLFIVTSISHPQFNNKVVDRFIVASESSSVKCNIIINKIDLDEKKTSLKWNACYKQIGYDVFLTSTLTQEGFESLHQALNGKKNLFWGHSGVGKSSLLNSLYPSLNLKVGLISSFNQKGKHTTVTNFMMKVENDTYIIDTPGIREIDPFGIKKQDVGHFFREFSEFIPECKFNTCTHNHEPGCAVVEAVRTGKVSEIRYDSYLRILDTIEEDINF